MQGVVNSLTVQDQLPDGLTAPESERHLQLIRGIVGDDLTDFSLLFLRQLAVCTHFTTPFFLLQGPLTSFLVALSTAIHCGLVHTHQGSYIGLFLSFLEQANRLTANILLGILNPGSRIPFST